MKNYAGKGSYGNYWDSWKPTLWKFGLGIAVYGFALTTYGVLLSSWLKG